jgi:glutamate synthase (NADPH/NADH) large chain
MAYLPQDRAARFAALERVERIAREEGLVTLGWREVPVTESIVGQAARETMPFFAQLFVAAADGDLAGLELDRVAFALRKRAERELDVYFPSLSARTIVYKGMLTTGQLEPFFPDLSDQRFTTELALVHSRFSTNTFPSWPLAHPYRLIAHNGEINTVKGNRNWMRARENQLLVRPHPRRPAAVVPDLHAPRPRTRRPSTRCSSCSTSVDARCRTRCS